MRKRDPERRMVKLTLLLTSTLLVMVTGVIVPALPLMEANFGGVRRAALWVRFVVTIPSLFIAVVAPLAGSLVDRIGRKKVVAMSTLLFGLSGVAGFFAPTMAVLLVSRASLGIALGGLMTSVTTLIADYYAGEERRQFMGLQAAAMGFGGTASLALGGVLADVGWRVPFLAYSFGFVLLPPILLILYEPAVGDRCKDRPNLLSEAGVCAAESVRASPDVAERRLKSSVPLGLILFVYALALGMQVIVYLLPMQLPFYLRDFVGAGVSRSGLAIAAMSGAYALASLAYGRLAARLDHVRVLSVAIGLIGVGFLTISVARAWVPMLLGLLLAGTGQGILTPGLNVWVADEAPAEARGRALGGLATAVFLGIFVSPMVAQPVSAAVGFRSACLIGAGLMLGLAGSVWVLRGRLDVLTECVQLNREADGHWGLTFDCPLVAP